MMLLGKSFLPSTSIFLYNLGQLWLKNVVVGYCKGPNVKLNGGLKV